MVFTTVYSVGKGYEVVNARSLWGHSEMFVPYFIDEFQFGQSTVLLKNSRKCTYYILSTEKIRL